MGASVVSVAASTGDTVGCADGATPVFGSCSVVEVVVVTMTVCF